MIVARQARCASAATLRHSVTTRRRAHNMATVLSLRILCLVVVVVAEPAPGRVPKVYNALITSNQNLEPSKAYPIYQPVLHETFPFSLQPSVFFGDFPLGNGIHGVPILAPKGPQSSEPKPEEPVEKPSSAEVPPPPSEPTEKPENEKATLAPPEPPTTNSPIPLNEFGLPLQVLPLSRLDPAYQGFTHIGPFTYSYPSFRFYDPFDPFTLTPYASFPALYRPLTNVIGQVAPVLPGKKAVPTAAPQPPTEKTAQNPPPEPSDINILNFSSKDPAIPNVPPPPLPQGGLKPEKSE